VHQEFSLIPGFTATENILLNREPKKTNVLSQVFGERLDTLDYNEMNGRAAAAIDKMGFSIDRSMVINDMPVGHKQFTEIARELSKDNLKLLILDEPTAVLTPQETDELFDILRTMVREKGMTVILITHKLYEVMAISHRVGVMRQGKLVGLAETRQMTERQLAAMMVGREVVHAPFPKAGKSGEPLVSVENLEVRDHRGPPAVRGRSFQVHAHEVLGIAAVEGNGQSELLEAITGMRPIAAGEVQVQGRSVKGLTPGQIRRLGLGLGHLGLDGLIGPVGLHHQSYGQGKAAGKSQSFPLRHFITTGIRNSTVSG